jgi:hypothetical protein
MPRVRIPRPFAAIAVGSAVACSADPIVLCACSQVPPHTVVYGSVTDPSGEPVQGATVRMEAGVSTCEPVSETLEAATDAAGRYRLFVIRTTAAEQCVRLAALAPAASGWRGSDTVQFAIPPLQALGSDSVRRDIALRAP